MGGGGGEEGLGGFTPGKFLAYRLHNVASKAFYGNLTQFLNTIHRSVCCNCACVLQLG